MTLTGIKGTTYQLAAVPIGSGGEGDVYGITGMDYAAKIYKAGTIPKELEAKLRVMVENPPNAAVLSQVAWPLDMVSDESGRVCGFVMPKLHINAELGEIYKYPGTLPISYQQKISIAQNICVVISEVHKAGYVFGDFNPRNIGLDVNTGLVSFLDTDTYHVMDLARDRVFRCNVCAPGYAAPELLEKCATHIAEHPSASSNAYAQTPLPTFTRETDNFALAIHIFKLLMNGYTPFGGIIETASVSQSSPGIGDAAVRRNSYCFRPGYKPQSAAIPFLETLPEDIADLFTRAFIEGKVNPKTRPAAIEWHGALERYRKQLVTCPGNPLHQYDRKNPTCPLCEADGRYSEVLAGHKRPDSIVQAVYVPPPQVAAPLVQTPTPPVRPPAPPVQLPAPPVQPPAPPVQPPAPPVQPPAPPMQPPAPPVRPPAPPVPPVPPPQTVQMPTAAKPKRRGKLVAGFCLCIVIMVVTAIFSAVASLRVEQAYSHFIHYTAERYTALRNIEAGIADIHRKTNRIVMHAAEGDIQERNPVIDSLQASIMNTRQEVAINFDNFHAILMAEVHPSDSSRFDVSTLISWLDELVTLFFDYADNYVSFVIDTARIGYIPETMDILFEGHLAVQVMNSRIQTLRFHWPEYTWSIQYHAHPIHLTRPIVIILTLLGLLVGAVTTAFTYKASTKPATKKLMACVLFMAVTVSIGLFGLNSIPRFNHGYSPLSNIHERYSLSHSLEVGIIETRTLVNQAVLLAHQYDPARNEAINIRADEIAQLRWDMSADINEFMKVVEENAFITLHDRRHKLDLLRHLHSLLWLYIDYYAMTTVDAARAGDVEMTAELVRNAAHTIYQVHDLLDTLRDTAVAGLYNTYDEILADIERLEVGMIEARILVDQVALLARQYDPARIETINIRADEIERLRWDIFADMGEFIRVVQEDAFIIDQSRRYKLDLLSHLNALLRHYFDYYTMMTVDTARAGDVEMAAELVHSAVPTIIQVYELLYFLRDVAVENLYHTYEEILAEMQRNVYILTAVTIIGLLLCVVIILGVTKSTAQQGPAAQPPPSANPPTAGKRKRKMPFIIAGFILLLAAGAVIFYIFSLSGINMAQAEERLDTTSRAVRAHLESLEQQTRSVTLAVGSSAELVSHINEGNREALLQYIYGRKRDFNIDAITVACHEGIALARSHMWDSYGDDIAGVPSVAAGLRGEFITLYSATPTQYMTISSTSPVYDGDRLIGSIVTVMNIGTDAFVDRLSEIFNAEITIFQREITVASTIIIPETGQRTVGTALRWNVADTVLVRGESVVEQENIFGIPHLAYYFPLHGIDGHPVGVLSIAIPLR